MGKEAAGDLAVAADLTEPDARPSPASAEAIGSRCHAMPFSSR